MGVLATRPRMGLSSRIGTSGYSDGLETGPAVIPSPPIAAECYGNMISNYESNLET